MGKVYQIDNTYYNVDVSIFSLEKYKGYEKKGIGIVPRLALPIAVGIIGSIINGVETGLTSAGTTAVVQEAGIQLFYAFFREVESITEQDYIQQ